MLRQDRNTDIQKEREQIVNKLTQGQYDLQDELDQVAAQKKKIV